MPAGAAGYALLALARWWYTEWCL